MLENQVFELQPTPTELRRYQAHMQHTPPRPATIADSARANALLAEVRSAIARFRDVRIAQSEGYEQFAPQIQFQEYHFAKFNLHPDSIVFDPRQPHSLLYARDSAGQFILTGAMYLVSGKTEETALDSMIPLGIGRWHKHINWCLPKPDEQSRWGERKNGARIFGPYGVETRKECEDENGTFRPDLAGWMIHVNAFESDPAVIWGGDQMGTDKAHRH